MFPIHSKSILAITSPLNSQLLATSLVDLTTFNYVEKPLGCSDLADHKLHCPQNLGHHQIVCKTYNRHLTLL